MKIYMTDLYSVRKTGGGISEYNSGLVEIKEIRLIDNHVLWIEHEGGNNDAHPIEVMYITGY